MIKTVRNCCVALLLCCMSVLPQSVKPRFERQLFPGGAGSNRIVPDAVLLSGVAFPDFRDVWFFDGDGKEVPYLLIPAESPAPRWVSGNTLPVKSTKSSSGFEVDLGSAANVDMLRLMGIPAPFLKRFQLEGSGDRSHWTLLIAEGTMFDLPDEHLRQTEAGFPAGEYRYLRVTWDDRKSGIVPIPRTVSGRLVQRSTPAPPLRVAVPFERLSAGSGHSRFQLKLPGRHLPLAAVELTVNESRLLRPARITESRLSGGEAVLQTLGSSVLRRVVQDDLAASDLRIPITAPEGQEIELQVEDGDNPSLNLTGVTLEFTPQPWIYLESANGSALTAQYGEPQRSAPRYDLEAMRQYVTKKDLKSARWGEAHDLQPSTVSNSDFQVEAGAAIDRSPFRYSRTIPNSSGLTALVLDAAVLAHSRSDLSDLRIVDANGRQVPYLLEKRQDALTLELPPLVRSASSTPSTSEYSLTLPFENLPPARLVLTTKERLFERNVAVKVKRESTGTRSEIISETVSSSHWRHSDPDSPPPALPLDLHGSLGSASLSVIVDEGDNHPLAISGSRLDLLLYRVRFFYPANGKLTLLYGQDGLSAPRYDLQLLAPRLIGASSRELVLDKENAAATTTTTTGIQKKAFWIALGISVCAVLFLLVRLLRSQEAT